MPATLKLDKGFTKKLVEFKDMSPEFSKDLSGEELTAKIDNSQLIIEKHPGKPPILELSDSGGSFWLWIELRPDKIKKLKEISADL